MLFDCCYLMPFWFTDFLEYFVQCISHFQCQTHYRADQSSVSKGLGCPQAQWLCSCHLRGHPGCPGQSRAWPCCAHTGDLGISVLTDLTTWEFIWEYVLPARHRWQWQPRAILRGQHHSGEDGVTEGLKSGGRKAQASLSLSQKRVNCMQNNGIFCSFSTKRIFYVPSSYAISNFAFYVNTYPQQQELSQANLNKYSDFGLPGDIIFEQESLPIVAVPQ